MKWIRDGNIMGIDIIDNVHIDAFQYNYRAHYCQINIYRCAVPEFIFSLGVLGYMLITTCWMTRKYTVCRNMSNEADTGMEMEQRKNGLIVLIDIGMYLEIHLKLPLLSYVIELI